MNKYLKNLDKIEFAVTYACTGQCIHCSEGEHKCVGERIDPQIAGDAVRFVAEEYEIKTVMAFGGEPLLYPDAVEKIMLAAMEVGVPKRQVITNGYFSQRKENMRDMALMLHGCGVNDLLLSVDAFHQRTIPLDVVKEFATEAKRCKIPLRLQPAWLVSAEDRNPYNIKTREILDSFSSLGFAESEGNLVFPEGNAKIYLSEYFTANVPENPYRQDPCDVKCLSFSPNGDVLCGNVYKNTIIEIIEGYEP